MKRVQLILEKTVIGHVEIYADVVETPEHFQCVPPGLLSFKDVQQVARRIMEGGPWGYIERYRWQLESGS